MGVILAAVGAAIALVTVGILIARRIQMSRAELDLWTEATDPVTVTLEDRLNDLTKTMTEASRSLGLVTVEMDLRRAEVERLQREQRAAGATKALTDEQLAAIRS